MADEQRRVAPLSELDDYEVADHNPDVRGWDVMASDGRRIGEVEDLIVDTGALKVRYLEIEVDRDFRSGDRNERILVPVGQARLHESEDHVHVGALTSADVRTYPAYSGRLERTYENSLHGHFGGTSTRDDADYYEGDHFDDSRFYGSRHRARGAGRGRDDRITLSEEQIEVNRSRQEAGEVRVGKRVEIERVKKEVPVMRERATVERRPLEGDERHARPRITEDEIRVPLMEEQVTVQKRTVPTEELVVKKHKVQDTETVKADLRRERADIKGDVRETRPGSRARD